MATASANIDSLSLLAREAEERERESVRQHKPFNLLHEERKRETEVDEATGGAYSEDVKGRENSADVYLQTRDAVKVQYDEKLKRPIAIPNDLLGYVVAAYISHIF